MLTSFLSPLPRPFSHSSSDRDSCDVRTAKLSMWLNNAKKENHSEELTIDLHIKRDES